jgi:tRNA (guanine6-N2)-methyltransferase
MARTQSRTPSRPQTYYIEADVADGLESVSTVEIRTRFDKFVRFYTPVKHGKDASTEDGGGVVQFSYEGDLRELLKLQTIQALYLLQRYPISRPKALLGDEHLRNVRAQIATVRGLHPAGTFKTLRLNAAGSDSTVMMRLKTELARAEGLEVGEDEGDLLIRVRPTPSIREGDLGWDVLVRLSPRPLATRAWRVCNFEGALNGAVAHALVRLTHPSPRDVYLNIACGSGTLLVERLLAGPARHIIGCDIDPVALACAQQNVAASGAGRRIKLHRGDGRALPLPNRSINAITADLPFGHLVGSHAENVRLYPLILQEAARVARPRAFFGVITHEVRLMEQLLAAEDCAWSAEKVLRVELGGLHPRIFVLQRK